MKPGGIGYVVSAFPQLSESFIYNEVIGLIAAGVEITVFSLNRPIPEQAITDTTVLDLILPHVVYFEAPLSRPEVLRSLCRMAAHHPIRLFKTLRIASRLPLHDYSWIARQASCFAEIIAEYGCARLHVHFAGYAARHALMISDLLSLPLSVTTHGHDIFRSRPGTLDVVGAHAEYIFTATAFNKKFIVDKFGVLPEKLIVNPNGIRPEVFDPGEPAKRQRGKILTVARLHPIKGLQHAVAAAGLLRDRAIDFHWVFIGDGTERDSLLAQVASLNLGKHVTFLGAQPSSVVRAELKSAAVFVLSSLSEGQGVSYLEAMAMEVPVVGTDVNGVNETVLDGVNGFLVLPASPELLAGRIAELLGNDDLRRRMGQAGRSHVLERFDLQRSVRLMIDTWNGRKVPDRT
jgi:glycosyltransferase involved in cell wall biosynthesis